MYQKASQIIQKVNAGKNIADMFPTGFPNLDKFLDGGFMRKELVVLGAHTGLGKSYVAGQLVLNIARQHYKTAYFSLEISNEMVLSRMVGAIANIKPTKLQYGLLDFSQHADKLAAQKELIELDEYLAFYDNLYDLDEIIKEITENNFDFVVVDFIQNIFLKGKADEYQKLSEVALLLQQAAKNLNCTILLLSQLSNAAARIGSSSNTVEYKGSGSIATACDLGFFIERSEYIEGSKQQELQLKLRKNRRGVSGMYFPLYFKHPGGYISEKTL